MKKYYCVGITDRVFFRKDQNKAHSHVFFYEVDKKNVWLKPIKTFFKVTNHPLCIFETKKGYHFVSPEILRRNTYNSLWYFITLCYKNFSDYKREIQPHILRLSWKKNNNPPPKLVYSYLPQNKNYSRAHLKAFKIPYAKITTRRTFAEYCLYQLGKKGREQ